MSKRKENKSGLSRIAINLIIILLIVIIAGVIFFLVRDIINNQGKQEVFDDSTLDLKISQVQKINDNTLDVTVKRNEGKGQFVALSFAVDDGALMEIVRVNSSMSENQNGSFSLNFILLNASKIKRVSVTPIFIDENGEEVIGNVKDEYITPNVCSNYCPINSQCGVNDCGIKCGNGCSKGYLCLNYKCIREQSSSGGGGSSGGSSSTSTTTPTCTDTCESLGYECGINTVCSQSIDCGNCEDGFTCQTNGTCITNPLNCTDTCLSLGYQCGDVTICEVTTNCGICTLPKTCNVSNMCSCTPETNTSFCTRLNKTCGSVTALDNCGINRTVSSCGSCSIEYSCAANGTCILNCTTHSYSTCYNGDVYWYNSCNEREEIRYDCNSTQICSSGQCVDCTTHSYSACYGGDVYWYNSCGTRETIRYDCNSTQTCSSGVCVNNPPAGTQIIADHTIVDRYDDIPQCWIDEVKKMRLVIGGESHSAAYREGLNLLEIAYSAYQVNVGGVPPEGETTSYLRASGVMWGDLWSSNQWVTSYGEEDWFTSATGIYNSIEITKKGITYCNTNDGWYIDAFGLGWCWDQGTNVNTYLNATQQYIDYCIANGYTTKILFTTGPVDSYAPADGYQKYLDYEATRNYVIADSSRVLFDYADILVYNDAGEEETSLYNGNTYQVIHPDNMEGTYTGHIGSVGAIRLAKAQWWMMARIAGWDGTPSDACP